MSEEQKENKSFELAGLWKQPKGHFSGQAKMDIEIKEGEYFNLFVDNNTNPKSPNFNLVIYRGDD